MKHDPTLYEPMDRRWCYIFSAVASVIGSVIQAGAAEDAAEAQAASADKAIALGREGLAFQQEMFDVNRADTDPYRASGTAALGTINDLFIPGGQNMVQMHSQLNELRARREVLARTGGGALAQPATPGQQTVGGPPFASEADFQNWQSGGLGQPSWVDPGGAGSGGDR
jgi:hypothetical protein